VRRLLLRVFKRLPWWVKLLLVAASPVVTLNLLVSLCGQTVVFPLSPYFLEQKAIALGRFAKHLPRCLFTSRPPLPVLIARSEAAHRLPPGLLAAIVAVESEGKAHRISAAGAMGPAQLTADTADHLGVTDPFDPEQAVDGAARYLARLLRRYRGDVRLSVAAYNAGPGAVSNRVPKNGETEYYVPKVIAELQKGASPRAGGFKGQSTGGSVAAQPR